MTRLRLFTRALALTLALCADVSVAQGQDATLARIVVIQPKPGKAAEFEAGYKRHLEWHRQNGDPWQWYGWTFVLGNKLGLFMDGTFGHTSRGLDAAIKPAEDRADNEINVTPHADFVSHGVYERLDKLTRGAPLPDKSPLLALNTYRVIPGQEAAFESALMQRAGASGAKRFTCYKLRIGGSGSEYILMRPATSFGDATALPDIEFPAGVVEQATSELLRYQPALSYEP